MANMGYCRFQNTLLDLFDCEDHLNDHDLNDDEKYARANLIEVCRRIVRDFEDFEEEYEEEFEEDEVVE